MLCFLVLYAIANAMEPAYIIDFEKDEPVINFISDQLVEVTGNVLTNDASRLDAGFDYKITLNISGGPNGTSPINFLTRDNQGSAEMGVSKFDTDKVSRGLCGGDIALCYAFKGRDQNPDGQYTYLRDPSSKMRFTLEFDNNISLENITYTLGDMDYNFIGGQGSTCEGFGDLNDYSCRYSYIDQITVLSGAGSNEYIIPDPTMIHQADTDKFYAKFPDANNNQRIDIQNDGRIPGDNSSGNISIYNANNIGKQVIFEYNDPGFGLENDPDGFHDFDSYNQLMSFLTGMTFDAVECSMTDIDVSIQDDTYPFTLLTASTTVNDNRTLTYQWQVSTVNCEEGFTDIPNANAASYSPTDLTSAGFFRVLITEHAGDETVCTNPSPCIPLGSINGCVHEDVNRDGNKDAEDIPMADVFITLYNCSDRENAITTITTDENGQYSFYGLADGNYIIRTTPPYGYIAPNQSAIDSEGYTSCMAVNNGSSNDNCNLVLGTILGACTEISLPTTQTTIVMGDEFCMPIENANLYSFSPSVGVSCTDCEEVCFSPSQSTTYTIIWNDIANYDCSHTAELTINVDRPTPPPVDPIPALVGDFVFEDLDKDGIQDEGEPGIPNVTVKLQDPMGNTLQTVNTDENGNYSFTIVAPTGMYKIMFNTPTGFEPTQQSGNAADGNANDSDNDPQMNMTDLFTVSPGDNITTIDAGFIIPDPIPAQVGDFVFEDLDKDGIQDDGEPGIPNVTVKLQNEDGITLQTTTTDADGKYNFTILDPNGFYKIMFNTPTDFEPTQQSGTASDGGVNDSDNDPATGMTDLFLVNPGDNIPTIDAGFIVPAPIPAQVGDFVFEDLDKDGIQDNGEPGIPNVTVKLQDAAGNTLQTTTTDEDGKYSFTIEDPQGLYKVMFNTPTGFEPTQQSGNASDDGGDNSDNDPLTSMTDLFPVNPGDNIPTIDAGFIVPDPIPAQVGDFVFEDLDKDGIQDNGEPGIQNVTVKLQDAAGNTLQTTTTDDDGRYSFTIEDPSGLYKVMFNTPEGFEPTQQSGNASDDGGDNSDNDPLTSMTDLFPINPGDNIRTIDAGFIMPDPIEPAPTCGIGVNITEGDIYEGEETCVIISTAVNYVVSPSNGVTKNGSSLCLSPTENTVYTITSTDPGCSDQVQVEIRIWNELCNVTLSETEKDIFIGEQACITVTGPTSYTVSPTDGVSQSGSNLCLSPTSNTVYTVVSTDQAGCTESAQIEVRIWNETPIPTMSQWGLMIFGLLILNIGLVFIRKQEQILLGTK